MVTHVLTHTSVVWGSSASLFLTVTTVVWAPPPLPPLRSPLCPCPVSVTCLVLPVFQRPLSTRHSWPCKVLRTTLNGRYWFHRRGDWDLGRCSSPSPARPPSSPGLERPHPLLARRTPVATVDEVACRAPRPPAASPLRALALSHSPGHLAGPNARCVVL